ncbi:MAG: hypothetical protein KBF89_05165 [Acidimicrobiia bacterium]|nr:hypothetical protein [Acidimicrobiia bacterium]
MTQSNLDKEFKSQEWNETVLKTVDSIVEIANKKVVMPAHRIARFFVYTFVAIVLLVIVFILLSISSFRLLNLAMPVWASYLTIGAIFVLIGSIFWAKK